MSKQDRKEEYKEQAAIQDSFKTGGLESQMAAAKQKKRSQKKDLIDPEDVKQNLRRALLGKENKWKPIQGEEGQYKQVTVDISKKKLCNEKGFGMVWNEIEGTITRNMAGSYLPRSTVRKNIMSNMKSLIDQIFEKRDEYGIDDRADGSQILDIVFSQILATTSKAIGGRGMESREKTRIEKFTHAFKGGEEDENLRDKIGSGLEF